jgi:hypothetical protein
MSLTIGQILRVAASCSAPSQVPCKGALRQVFNLSEAPSSPKTPHSPPPLTHCTCVYSILINTGKRGGEELTKEKAREAIVHNMTDYISSL